MFVNATAGSTVYGAFDPIHEIADICEKYNMWLHVDVRASSYYVYRKVIVILIISGLIAVHFHGGLRFSLNTSAILRSIPYPQNKPLFLFRVHGEEAYWCPGSTGTSCVAWSGRLQPWQPTMVTHTHTHTHTGDCGLSYSLCSVFTGPTQSPGTLTRWWVCHCSALPFWSERGYEQLVTDCVFIYGVWLATVIEMVVNATIGQWMKIRQPFWISIIHQTLTEL